MADKSKFWDALTAAVATGCNVKSAAAVANCSESHAYRLAKTDDFKTRVSELRTEAVQQAVSQLSSAASQAVATLVELLGASQEPSTRLNASKAILGQLGPLTDIAELRSRIDAIERANATTTRKRGEAGTDAT